MTATQAEAEIAAAAAAVTVGAKALSRPLPMARPELAAHLTLVNETNETSRVESHRVE